MSKISDLLDEGRTYSFEFFPPRNDEAERALEKALGELEPLEPSFVSCTYGAGGSTRERTREVVLHIHRDTPMVAMAHLSCIAHTNDELRDVLVGYQQAGIENILALAGDPPTDPDVDPGELEFALDLVELIGDVGDFSVGVAAHPELHPRSPDRESDRRHLAAKLEVADFGITQFFFRASDYLTMIEELDALGCETPVIPGIMPVTNAKQVQRFARLSGAEFPPDLAERFEEVAENVTAVRSLGVDLATRLCQELLDEGVPGLHFYTLNRSTATREIYANLGLSER